MRQFETILHAKIYLTETVHVRYFIWWWSYASKNFGFEFVYNFKIIKKIDTKDTFFDLI
jgi:ABC-type dipeptide/oligopeptide/nickel transport system permease component